MCTSGFFCDFHVHATENMTVRKSQGHIQSSNHILQNIQLSFIHTTTFFHNCNFLTGWYMSNGFHKNYFRKIVGVLVVVSKNLKYHSTGSYLACVLRVALCANVLWQISHLNGLIPLCVESIWFSRFTIELNLFLQSLHCILHVDIEFCQQRLHNDLSSVAGRKRTTIQ